MPMYPVTPTVPTPTVITVDDKGDLHVDTVVITKAQRPALIAFLQDDQEEILILPELGPAQKGVFLFLRALLTAYRQNARGAVVTSLANFVAVIADWVGFPLSGTVDHKGVPKKNGAVPAARAAATALTGFTAETHNAHKDPAKLNEQADYVQIGIDLDTLATSLHKRVSRGMIPVLKDMVQGARTVVAVALPVLETHPALSQVLSAAVSYFQDPHKKAGQNQKKNRAQKKAAFDKGETAALPAARDQVRGQVVGEVEDRMTGLLK